MKKILMTFLILLMLVGCTLPGLGGGARNDSIVIGSGNTTERQIISEVIAQMIKHHMPDIEVDILTNLGSSVLIQQAMLRSDANISAVMYTGTSLTGELNLPATTDTVEAFNKVVDGFSKEFEMVWFPSYGFANTYAFMVSKDFSKKHNLIKVSDMKSLANDLRAGIDTGWIDRDGDGYEAFKDLYGFEFGTLLPMEISLVYNAVQSGDMDVVLGYSTDGRIDAYDLVILEDDLSLFPPYDASPVTSKRLLEKHPEIENVLLMLEGKISASDMQALNRTSDEEKIEPQVVAEKFLKDNNYFEGTVIVPLKERAQYHKIMESIGKEDRND